ncbi:hypothetical protein CSB09_02130 [Candidatus Gracilibacteria bacterium]|nr:MAG: hypothetical protein CSB09_02130 [Candidatus Gracilibacteria bacterium]
MPHTQVFHSANHHHIYKIQKDAVNSDNNVYHKQNLEEFVGQVYSESRKNQGLYIKSKNYFAKIVKQNFVFYKIKRIISVGFFINL